MLKIRMNVYVAIKTDNKLIKISKELRCSKSHIVNESIEFVSQNREEFDRFIESRLKTKESIGL